MNEAPPQGAIPIDQFQADSPTNSASPSTATGVAPQGVAPPGAIPVDQFESDEDKYNTPIERAKGAVLGLERGISGGLSDVYRTKVEPNFVPQSLQTTPQELAAHIEYNPLESAGGNMLGSGAVLAGTGGITGFLPKGAGMIAKVGAMGAEGALLGTTNAVTDYALGDPDLNAQKVLAYAGMGAALGAGGGLLSEGALGALGKSSELAQAMKSKFGAAKDAIPSGVQDLTEDAAKAGVQPTSYDEMADKVQQAKFKGYTTDLPEKAALQDAISRTPLDAQVHPMQLESLGSQPARDAYKTYLEFPGKEGDVLRSYEGIQKREITDKIGSDISSMHPEGAPVGDAVQGGNQAIDAFTNQYQAEKKALGPQFESMKATPLIQPEDAIGNVIGRMSNEVPGVAKMFNTTGDEIITKPYSTAMGIDRATYNAVKEAVTAMKENPTDFESLQNIRKGFDQHVDVMSQGQAPSEIRSLKKAMMDYMQDSVQATHPDMQVREAFKRYAVNEQERHVIERAMGASVGTPEFGAISKIKPEQIGDRVFSNTATTRAAKNILPKEQFNRVLSNWLEEAKTGATDKGSFSSNKFNTFLKKNQDALRVAFEDDPAKLQHLNDLTTIARILPDSASINPSGTAKTFLGYFKDVRGVGDIAGGIAHFLKDKTLGKIEEQARIKSLNQALSGKADEATVLGEIKKAIKSTDDEIGTKVKGIFSNAAVRGVAAGAINSNYEKNTKRVQDLASSPTAMLDHMDQATGHLYSSAPHITQSLNTSLATAVTFLNSKIPKPNNTLPLSEDWEPTDAQKDKFNSYYRAVNDPVAALKDIKFGHISNETIEALQAVHPHLLRQMQMGVMDRLTNDKSKILPASVKIALSKFMGKPLENSLLPQVMAANQQSYAAGGSPNKQAQSQVTGKPSSVGMRNIDLSKRLSTRTQTLDEA